MPLVVSAESRSPRSLRDPSTITKEHRSGLKDTKAPNTLSTLSRPTGEGKALFIESIYEASSTAQDVARIM